MEVRKNFPRVQDWDKKSLIYCSRNRRSFNRIPKEYQPLMAPLFGKVIGEFVCDEIYEYPFDWATFTAYGKETFIIDENELKLICLSRDEFNHYGADSNRHKTRLYGLHISDLKIYDKPKELSEFTTPFCPYEVAKCKVGARFCKHYTFEDAFGGNCDYAHRITRPPQSWMYVEEI